MSERIWIAEMRRAVGAIALVASLLLAAAVPRVEAADAGRAAYRAEVEPICKRNVAANERILAGARARVRRGELRPAGRQFTRSSTALRRALVQLRGVPRPQADARRLSEWLARISRQASLLRKTGQALIAGNRRRAGKLVTRLSRGARLINARVVGFEFRHCRFEASRFT